MGTSSNHPGPNNRSPLVPPHADAEPGLPLPEPIPRRYQQFRKTLGDYIKSGDKADLNKSLRNYTQKATGGAAVAPRKYGTAISVANNLVAALSALSSGSSPESTETENIGPIKPNIVDAIGKPLDIAVQILADALAPDGEESDKIREALVVALSESLQDLPDDFDPNSLSEEIYIQTIIAFLAEVIFLDICIDAAAAFEKAESNEILEQREQGIRETIKAAIDKHLSTYLSGEVTTLSAKDLKEIQLSALKDVFSEWDGLL